MWKVPPTGLKLAGRDVHLWRANLDLTEERVEELASLLSEDERMRADRFRFDCHRQRFIAARGTLRKILAAYLDREPERLQFEYSDRGKPRLVQDCGGDKIQFNLSHSQSLALYGVRGGRPIGVDLEYLRPLEDVIDLARRFFCPGEYQLIESLSTGERQAIFFQIWTAKEAYLKATGDGLGGGLDRVEIQIDPGKNLRLLDRKGTERGIAAWSLQALVPRPNFIATVAVPDREIEFSYWQTGGFEN